MNCTKCGTVISADWRFCSSCGTEVSTLPDSQTAPTSSQGAQQLEAGTDEASSAQSDQRVFFSIGVVAVVLILVSAVILASSTKPNGGAATSTVASPSEVDDLATQAASDAVAEAVEAAASDGVEANASAPSNWTYSEDTDKIRNSSSYFATTTSTNTIHQDPPYDSDTFMKLTLRKSPAYGVDVILTISSGQMMCPSYEGCSGTIKFDNSPAQRVRFAGPADNSSDTIFLEGTRAFIAKLKTAKKLVVEKTLYQAGNPQFEFDVSGLKWAH